MKYGNTNYIELPREVFNKDLSLAEIGFFAYLNEQEHKYCDNCDYFLHSDEQVCEDLGISIKTIQKYKRHLRSAGLIRTSTGRYKYQCRLYNLVVTKYWLYPFDQCE